MFCYRDMTFCTYYKDCDDEKDCHRKLTPEVNEGIIMKKVFIDCGANDGCSIELFRKHYPNANEYEIHSFEPNPLFKEKLQSLNVNYYEAAISTADGIHNFYLDQWYEKDVYTHFGSTLMREKISKKGCPVQEIKVQGIDFSKWILNNFSINDYIVLKMDVEGAEYVILKKMINDGSLDYINVIYIEFHGRKFIIHEQEMYEDSINQSYLNEMKKRNIEIFNGSGKWNTIRDTLEINNKD